MRQRYEAGGLLGLTDRRSDKRIPVTGRVDERVVAAMRTADRGDKLVASSPTVSFVVWAHRGAGPRPRQRGMRW